MQEDNKKAATAKRLAWGWMLSAALMVVAMDQLTKALVMSFIEKGQVVAVLPGLFNLTLHFNRGAAFGMLANLADGARQAALVVTTVVALACVVYLLIKDYLGDRLGQVALALIVGGALGNIVDRLQFGEVVDFLDFYYTQYHWPAFNLADSMICIGVAVLLLKPLTKHKREKAKEN
jgi:signal peptidase II